MVIPREAPHKIMLRVENFETNVANRGRKIVINDRAIRRILGSWLLGGKRRTDKGIVIDANRGCWPVKPGRGRASRFKRLTERRNVIQNPERTAVRGNHQVIAVDGEIANRRGGQVQLQRLPMVSVGER